ncbi:MAG: hypothetical protein H6626_05805 [Pseudobdellovibrionaceae bacterium]|nr:hypothetical protein [Bdellovibrionales bacterium]USN48608.1 MAG: hypothetical protein H6626_05805 [Pseudobdellovibrionaceae bacterium]
MSFLEKKNLMLSVVLSALLAVGCASESTPAPQNAVDTDGTDTVPDGSGSGSGTSIFDWGDSASAELTVQSLSTFSDYTGRPMYDPQDIKISLNLNKYGNGWGGKVKITYTDRGQSYAGQFTSLVRSGSRVDNNNVNNQYNIWFSNPANGEVVWHGFFEDERPSIYYQTPGQVTGAIVLVIDQIEDQGDGQGPSDLVGGSVWYKNFEFQYSPLSPTSCWFVYAGPYDCRAWKSGDGLATQRAVNPDAGYVKLGEFTDLSLSEAFNGIEF